MSTESQNNLIREAASILVYNKVGQITALLSEHCHDRHACSNRRAVGSTVFFVESVQMLYLENQNSL
jgi:hypothetical protein